MRPNEIQEKILKELKLTNETLKSIRTFIIAECQLIKTLNLEVKSQGRDIKSIKLIKNKMEEQ